MSAANSEIANFYYLINSQHKFGSGKSTIEIPLVAFLYAVEKLSANRFDEDWYVSLYEDVKKCLIEGTLESGFQHFISTGFLEGRVPHSVNLDSEHYLEKHDDVYSAILDGSVESAEEHFLGIGFSEARAYQEKPKMYEE